MIKPTIGRVVWFTPAHNRAEVGFTHYDDVAGMEGNQVHAAMIVYVWSDSLINLVVFDHDGTPHPKTSVPLVQADEPKPESGYFASWMPFQVGQAKAQAKA